MNFDIDRYLQLVEPLDDGDIDDDAFIDEPLDADTLRCLRYMHDVEFHTTCSLRDLLVTAAHDDPEITAFLAMWSYEEYWHGEAIAKVLARGAATSTSTRARRCDASKRPARPSASRAWRCAARGVPSAPT
jgi:hypothetical protein